MKKVIPVLIASIMISCAGNKNDQSLNNSKPEVITFESPLKGDFQNDTIFKLDPTVENTFETPNGSSIKVPANSLVDADGKEVTDKVELSFTQYHSAADIIGSGIPMTYDSAGIQHNFESAGMFSLNAKVNNKPVYVKDGKSLKVNLASDKNDDFNFYAMDNNTGHWTYEFDAESPVSNSRYDPSQMPLKPERATKNAFVLDLNFDFSDFAELTQFSGIVWEYVGEHDSLDPRKNAWVSKTRWTDFELVPTYEKGFEYFLTMKNEKTNFKTKVKAALNEKDYEAAMTSYQVKKVEIADKKDQLQKPYIRSVSIGGFGTYNYDYIHRMENPQRIMADFDFIGHEKDKHNALVFVVYPESQATINYPEDMWINFALDKGKDPKILAVMPDNKIAVCSENVSNSFGKDKYTFKMKVLDKDVSNKGELERLIANL